MEMIPQLPSHQGNRVRKGGTRFAIPRCAAHAGHALFDQQMRVQRHERVEAQQRRGSTGNRTLIPLALRLQPQMGPRFFKRHFHRPAPDKPGQYLCRHMLQIGRQQGLRFEAFVRVSDQHPAERATGGFPV